MKQKFGTDVREFGECVRRSSGAAFVAREIAAMAGASVEEKERVPSRREEREREGKGGGDGR